VENFLNGHGLRWNIDQRVQTYTHPLWMFLLIPARGITGEFYYSTTVLSLSFATAAYTLLALRLRLQPVFLIVGLLIPTLLSKSIVLFSTSGFENPLSMALLASFAHTLLTVRHRQSAFVRLTVIVSLAAINRLDHVLLFIPALCWSWWPRRKEFSRLLLGLAPLLLWLLFATFYYGFPTPNTAPAKLSSSVPLSWYCTRGLIYLLALFQRDLPSALILSVGVVLSVYWFVRCLRTRRNEQQMRLALLGIGAALYCLYVIRVGGDFISGRFWTSPILVGLLVVSTSLPRFWMWLVNQRWMVRTTIGLAAVGGIAVCWLGSSSLAKNVVPKPVELDRSLAHVFLKRDLTWGMTEAAVRFRKAGVKARHQAEQLQGTHVVVFTSLGFAGLEAGPSVVIIDRPGLGDPLLARLAPSRLAFAGHLYRRIPEGYVKARQLGDLGEMEPSLASYYEKLRLVVSGPLFDMERIQTIVALNLGTHAHLLNEFENSVRVR
jgi:arabinofuranosyltransferase